MFGYSLIKTVELDQLKERSMRLSLAEDHVWWPHQKFVHRLLKRVVSGERNMEAIRRDFNDELAKYVNEVRSKHV